MDISNISASMVASGSAVQTGDAVAISTQKKAMDLQASQAQQLIESVKASAPTTDSGVDVYA
jgi:predicted RecA/RadA family phage recombinase